MNAASSSTSSRRARRGVWIGCMGSFIEVRVRSRGKVELPRHAEAVADPTESPAEPVVVERHEYLSAVRKFGEAALLFRFVFAVDEHRDRRRERERVLHRAVRA